MNIIIRRTIAGILVAVSVLALGMLALSIPVGIQKTWNIAIVNNDDMSPAISKGSLVISQRVPSKSIKENDIVSLNAAGNSEVATVSRVIEIIPADEKHYFYRVQGDNNDLPDDWSYRVGNDSYKLLSALPVLGYVALALNNPVGATLFCVFVLGLVLTYIFVFFKRPERKPVIEDDDDYSDSVETIASVFEEAGAPVKYKVKRKRVKRVRKTKEVVETSA